MGQYGIRTPILSRSEFCCQKRGSWSYATALFDADCFRVGMGKANPTGIFPAAKTR